MQTHSHVWHISEHVNMDLVSIIYRYLAHHSLHDGIKSTLWSVPISRDLLFLHLLSESRYLLCQ